MQKKKRTHRVTQAVLIVTFSLYPIAAIAGSLEPAKPPAPTMKSLDEIPPTWSQRLMSSDGDENGCNSSRFRCVMNSEAVVDLETGLVWQRRAWAKLPELEGNNDPLSALFPRRDSWIAAYNQCLQAKTGDRRGWRLPSAAELASLLGTSAMIGQDGTFLPSGNPFVTQAEQYWTSTVLHGSTLNTTYMVDLSDGGIEFAIGDTSNMQHPWWCVRGGAGPAVP